MFWYRRGSRIKVILLSKIITIYSTVTDGYETDSESMTQNNPVIEEGMWHVSHIEEFNPPYIYI